MGSSALKREILGIALLLFAVFLAGAFATLGAGATARGRRASKRASALSAAFSRIRSCAFFGWPAARAHPARAGGPRAAAVRTPRVDDRSVVDDLLRRPGRAAAGRARARARRRRRRGCRAWRRGIWGEFIAWWWRSWFGAFGAWVVVVLAASVLMAATLVLESDARARSVGARRAADAS